MDVVSNRGKNRNDMDKNRLEQLLNDTKKIVKHQKEKEELRGEKFNVFSILKVESMENKTHSAFLCELLNPKGSHLKGNIFLKLFIETAGIEGQFDAETAQAKTEHSIGQINEKEKTGGRIDIYLWDKNRNCISIENKIYAGDQFAQIERYCNYNKGKNRIYYLTRNGDKPSDESKGQLESGSDFFIISYGTTIIEWLKLCLKEAAETPILRETIKQYIILIKKITHTMENTEEEKELLETIIKYHKEAKYIANNLIKAVARLNREIQKKAYSMLLEKLDNAYIVTLGNKPYEKYSQIWFKIRGKEESKLFFGLESFAVEGRDACGDLGIGIFVNGGNYNPDYSKLGEKESNWWIEFQRINDYDGCRVNLTNSETLKRLQFEPEFQTKFVNHIVEESIEYLNRNREKVAGLLKDKIV